MVTGVPLGVKTAKTFSKAGRFCKKGFIRPRHQSIKLIYPLNKTSICFFPFPFPFQHIQFDAILPIFGFCISEE